MQKNEFLQREATIYHNVYQEILQATDYYCKQHGIDIVLRFNGDQVDPQQPDSVLTFINKPVVWYQTELGHHAGDFAGIESDGDQSRPASRGAPARPAVPFNR